ncbi:MAG: hypothetical protein CSB55_00415 [Candidatus Cloacimonadota bacterium]|nr:MAG: hypothetical protein CSB55_00415 [Candidatus Cloacimonadota bacterium]
MKKQVFILLITVICTAVFAKVSSDEAIARLQKVSKTDFPEASYITVDNEIIDLDETCKGQYYTERYKRVLTEKGRKDNELWFFYDTMYDTLFVKTIEIFKASGERIKLNPDDILSVQTNAFDKFSNIYSDNGKVLTGTLPNLEIDDIVRTVSVRTVHNTRMENNFFTEISVNSYEPALHQYLEINAPGSVKLNIHHLNKSGDYVTYDEKTEKGVKSYKFNVNSAHQIIYEPGMENPDEFTYRIIITTLDNWEQLSKWYYGLVAPHLEINDDIIAKTNELTAGCKTREEKAQKLYYWVARKIRYLGVDKEDYKPGYEPHDAAYTFSTMGGVCRDKAALLVAMLRIAGIEADPILIANGYKLNPEAPVMWFNHAVAVSYDENGEPEFFYDPTDENTKELFPQYLEDCSYIIASEKGETLRTVPLSGSEKNRTDIKTYMKIDKENKAESKINFSYFGLADGFFRSYMMNINELKKREMIESVLSKVHPFAKLKNYKISDPKDTEKYMTVEIEFEIPDYVTDNGEILIMPLEAYKFSLSFIYNYQLQAFNMSSRRYPFKLPNTYSIRIEEKTEFPYDIKTVSLPEVKSLDLHGIKFTSESEADHRSINIKTGFSIDQIHFKQKDFIRLKEEIARLASYSKLYLILEK